MCRRKRIAELQAKAQKDVYGDLVSISEPEYKEVVNTPNTWVVVFLHKSGYRTRTTAPPHTHAHAHARATHLSPPIWCCCYWRSLIHSCIITCPASRRAS